MTEMVNGMSQSQDTSSSQPVQTASTPAYQPAETQERTFRQSEVTDIVKRTKQEALESFKRMQSEQPQYLQQKMGNVSDQNQQQQPYQNANNNMLSDEQRVRKMAAEEAQRLRDEWIQSSRDEAQQQDAQRTVQEFWNKISTGREKYQDFEQTVGDIEYARFPNVVQLLARYVDNADSVLYELGKDRIKMANLEQLANMSPRDAIVQAQRLAQSIKDNHDASKMKVPNEPLSQMKPSNTGTESGAMSVKDYRRKYRV